MSGTVRFYVLDVINLEVAETGLRGGVGAPTCGRFPAPHRQPGGLDTGDLFGQTRETFGEQIRDWLRALTHSYLDGPAVSGSFPTST